MSGSAEEVREHIKLYWRIGAGLLALTVVTVGVSYIEFAAPMAIFVALVIASAKGSLVAGYFMHLIGERRSVLVTLALTAFFFVVLILIPILGHNDTYGEHTVVPNADAPAAAEAAH